MSHKSNLTGQTFGRLTVLRESTYKNNTGRTRWLCECECGDKVIVGGANLIQGGTRSCGCLRDEHTKNFFKQRRLDYKARSMYSTRRKSKSN